MHVPFNWVPTLKVIGQIIPRRGRPLPVKRGFHIERTTLFPNRPGNRECARRRKQIAEGRLKAENGLEATS